MEDPTLGAIKLKYNNEVIKIKDLILQAKIRAINHLTRKLKQLRTRKGDEKQLEKNKRKVDSFIAEIKLLKCLHRNEVANFAMENIENLSKYMNTSSVSKEKAMARLLSREPINSKCKELKGNFSIVPTTKLLEQNLKKVKRKIVVKAMKEKKLKRSMQTGTDNKIVSDVLPDTTSTNKNDESEIIDDIKKIASKPSPVKDNKLLLPKQKNAKIVATSPVKDNQPLLPKQKNAKIVATSDFQASSSKSDDNENVSNDENSDNDVSDNMEQNIESEEPSDLSDEPFDDEIDEPMQSQDNNASTHIDPFFIQKGGNDYVTLTVPRPPDKKVGGNYADNPASANRKMRRAAQFNRDAAPRERKKLFKPKVNPKFDSKDNRFDSKNNKNFDFKQNDNKNNFKANNTIQSTYKNVVEEKLHPSWEAKKQKSTILPFKGNKIVFDV